jgi:hypothetical protein
MPLPTALAVMEAEVVQRRLDWVAFAGLRRMLAEG